MTGSLLHGDLLGYADRPDVGAKGDRSRVGAESLEAFLRGKHGVRGPVQGSVGMAEYEAVMAECEVRWMFK